MTPFWIRASGLTLLIGGVGWALVGLIGGWLGAAALGLTPDQLRAAMHPFLILLLLGLPGVYFGLRTGRSWLLLGGVVVTAVGLVLALLGSIGAFGLLGAGGDLSAEITLGVGTIVIGAGALVVALGLIRQGGTADWVPLLLAALGLAVIPALIDARLAVLPGVAWAALGFTVWIAAGDADSAPK
ncbi:MAG TPA: hypothetical protein VER79_01170 [Candidatus Limnocylindrales bacterium]|nr:hypothetical protein [Candidatus Limnocylindrales bacterium]